MIVRAKSDHAVVGVAEPNTTTGVWTCNLYTSEDVYARIETHSGSEQDLIFAKGGLSYLGGDFPDGIARVEGVPTAADIRLQLRSDDPVLSGALIATAKAPASGQWKIAGLQAGIEFDVVGRHPDYGDKMVSAVSAVPDSVSAFHAMGSVIYQNARIAGLLIARDEAALPLTASITGTTLPYNLGSSSISIDGNRVLVDYPMRDYGDFDLTLTVEGANSTSLTVPISVAGGERSNFVTRVAALTPADRGNTSSAMTMTIPASVQEGDILVLAIMRRATATVSDNNGGVWTFAESRSMRRSTCRLRRCTGAKLLPQMRARSSLWQVQRQRGLFLI